MAKAEPNTILSHRSARRAGRGTQRASWSPTAIALVLLAGSMLACTALLLAAGALTWRWAGQHLQPPHLASSQPTTVNRTELVHAVQAFQLVSVRQTYATRTQQTVSQAFNIGTSRVTLPDWLAGEQVTVQGQTEILAGVDMAQVRPEDIVVSGSGKALSVQVNIPAATILSSELVPNSLEVSTETGLLPQLEQSLGIGDDQLRTRAADLLLQAGRQAAVQQGIEASASVEAQRRLTDFLQTLPTSGGPVTYHVTVQTTPT